MKEYNKPTICVEEAVMVSMIADSISLGVSDDSADQAGDVLGNDRQGFGDLW